MDLIICQMMSKCALFSFKDLLILEYGQAKQLYLGERGKLLHIFHGFLLQIKRSYVPCHLCRLVNPTP